MYLWHFYNKTFFAKLSIHVKSNLINFACKFTIFSYTPCLAIIQKRYFSVVQFRCLSHLVHSFAQWLNDWLGWLVTFSCLFLSIGISWIKALQGSPRKKVKNMIIPYKVPPQMCKSQNSVKYFFQNEVTWNWKFKQYNYSLASTFLLFERQEFKIYAT